MILGVSEKVEEKGPTIGKHIVLVGFDNREFSLGVAGGITTAETPLNDMGRKCAELIIQQLNKRRIGKRRILLPCKLHIRISVSDLVSVPREQHYAEVRP